MIEVNNFGLPPEFPNGKAVVIENFIEIILKNAPEYDCFSLHEMVNSLELEDIEKKQFKYLAENLRKTLIKKGLIEFTKGSNLYVELTEKGRKYFDEKIIEPINFTQNIENYIGGNNHGIQSSRSDFIKPAIQNANKITETKPPKKSFLEIASWVIGGVAAIIAIYEFIIK
ncbi:MAG: hypothetical protein ACI7YS_15260 [Flavobacterium sp.]